MKSMEMIRADRDLERLYYAADTANRAETARVIDMLDSIDPSDPLQNMFGRYNPASEIRNALVRIVKAHSLLGRLTREGAVALKQLMYTASVKITVSPEIWHLLTEEERIVDDYDIDRLWRTEHGEDLECDPIDGLIVPDFGEDIP